MKKILIALSYIFFIATAVAQVPERNIDELKIESQLRADRGAYPMGGIGSEDAKEALSYIKTRERDDWAQGWGKVAEKYMAQAKSATNSKDSGLAYRKAWRLYYMAQWPVPNSPGKQQAYNKAISAYAEYAKTLTPELKVVKIPFENKTITAYVRLPNNVQGKVPMILAISGLDSRKETVAEGYAKILDQGIGFVAVDGPGTGQAPVKVSTSADKMFSAVLDYMYKMPEVDTSKIIVSGVSFGGYWAAKLAFTEKDRILASVAQSPPVHEFFSTEFLMTNTLGNREYLFDLTPAFINVFEGANSVEDLKRIMPPMSLKALGLLDKPAAPMLIVGGVKDTQVPISDLELLARSGKSPNYSWINPSGGHLGREVKGWTDPVILNQIIIPWELNVFKTAKSQ
jgi:esterase FrsA